MCVCLGCGCGELKCRSGWRWISRIALRDARTHSAWPELDAAADEEEEEAMVPSPACVSVVVVMREEEGEERLA